MVRDARSVSLDHRQRHVKRNHPEHEGTEGRSKRVRPRQGGEGFGVTPKLGPGTRRDGFRQLGQQPRRDLGLQQKGSGHGRQRVVRGQDPGQVRVDAEHDRHAIEVQRERHSEPQNRVQTQERRKPEEDTHCVRGGRPPGGVVRMEELFEESPGCRGLRAFRLGRFRRRLRRDRFRRIRCRAAFSGVAAHAGGAKNARTPGGAVRCRRRAAARRHDPSSALRSG